MRMLPQNHLAVVTRNITWSGPGEVASEPHECGWAREALIFVRALKPPSWPHGPRRLHVEVSPDGMHWVRHGATIVLPSREGESGCVPVQQFGGWLRIAGTLDAGDTITVLVSIHLKA
jgi:hypothetical protein